MPDTTLSLPWGHEKLEITLPAAWRLAGVLEPATVPPAANPAAEIGQCLAQPVGSPRLAEMVHPGMRVVIVVDDGSRPTPVALILPLVLNELGRGGVGCDDITLVPAIGLHRAMAESELAARAGAGFVGLKWENPDCDDPLHLADLGTTSRGTPVLINKTVAQAELIVSIGCIEPHIIASFGGGYKNLVPGVAGRATVAHNHALNCQPGTFNMVGQPIERNPMRLDLEEAAQKLPAPVFIVNAILDNRQRLITAVAGNPIAAHRAGVEISARMYGVKVPGGDADVIITASHPMDQDLRQGVKALANTIRALRPGGVLITLVRAEEGVGVFGLANTHLPLGRNALRAAAPLLVRLVPRLKVRGLGEEDRFFLYFALQAMRRGTLLMYGPTIPAEVQANLPFVQFVADPADAIARARRRFPAAADVVVFPHGGISYPIV